MIYRNKRYTALEILTELGQAEFTMGENSFPVAEIFGKGRVRIGGLSMASAESVLNVGNAESLEIVVGVEGFSVECLAQDGSEGHISEAAHAANEVRAKEVTIPQNEKVAKLKASMSPSSEEGEDAPE